MKQGQRDSCSNFLSVRMGTLVVQVFLDSKRDDVEAVEARLQEVEELALKNGHAIGKLRLWQWIVLQGTLEQQHG
jgi:hypothetical protein